MSILCRLFGHMRRSGWYGDGLYGNVRLTGADGTGRMHAHIDAACDRCGRTYVLGRFHPNSPAILSTLIKHGHVLPQEPHHDQ